MRKLRLKRGTDFENGSFIDQPHIMIVGQPALQAMVNDFIDVSIDEMRPFIESPIFSDVERCLRQKQPDLVIVTNFKMAAGLTLEKIIALVPISKIVVMCDEYTLVSVIPTGVYVTTTKMDMENHLLPIMRKILTAQGF